MEADTERVIRSFYGPSVGLLCSSDGAACIGRNGIKIEHLFQPFSTLNGDLTSRDISGQLHSGIAISIKVTLMWLYMCVVDVLHIWVRKPNFTRLHLRPSCRYFRWVKTYIVKHYI